MELTKKLNEIQKNLKSPKNQRNTFGNYNYRSCEDILEAVKPLLDGVALVITDEIVLIGDRYYVKATAKLIDSEKDEVIENTAYAREAEIKKGMDEAQITGSASSYARKYALNGLLLIDDSKDADTDEHQRQQSRPQYPARPSQLPAKTLLFQKIKKELPKLDTSKPITSEADIEAIKKVISDKSGTVIKDLKEITEETAKLIIGLWN
jgi:hypothetical protein